MKSSVHAVLSVGLKSGMAMLYLIRFEFLIEIGR
jgi:hypothetical protein